MKTIMLRVRIEPEVYEVLRDRSEEAGVSMSQMVRDLVMGLREEPSLEEGLYELAEETSPVEVGFENRGKMGDYDEVVEYIRRISDEGYQGTPEDVVELKRLEEEYGVKYNRMKGCLEMFNEGKWEKVQSI
jgi:hypothetical protein